MEAIKGSVISRGIRPRWLKNLLLSLSWKALPVLIVMSLLMSMAILVAPAPAMAQHEGEQTAAFLPDDTDIYLTVNLDPSEDQLAGFLGILNYWWQDPNVKAKWDEFMEQVELESSINVEDDILSWLGPELAIAMRNIAVEQDVEPDIIVFIGTSDKTASDKFINEKFLPQVIGETGTSGNYNGTDTLYFVDGPYCAFTDEYILVSSDQTFVEDTLDIMDGNSEQSSLADNPNFKEAQTALPDRVGMLYGNLEAFLDGIDGQTGLGISDIAPAYFATSIKFEGTGLTGTGYYPIPEGISFPNTQSVELKTARVIPGNALYVAAMDENACWTAATTYLQAIWQKITEVTEGELSEISAQIEAGWTENIAPVLSELSAKLSEGDGMTFVEAVSYFDEHFNLNLEADWENIKVGMGDLSEMTFAQAVAYLNTDLGLGVIWDEIVPLLTAMPTGSFEAAVTYLFRELPDLMLLSESAVAMLPPTSLDDEPDVLFITEASDVDMVKGYLASVTGFIDTFTETQVSTQTVSGVTVTTIGDGESLEMGYMFLNVEGTDYLIVGSTIDSLEAAVEVKNDSKKSLSQTDEYQGLEYQLGGDEGSIMGSFMYLNITSMLKIEALSTLEFGTSFDEQISQSFYYVPMKSAIGFTNPILGDKGITMNGAVYLLPPPLVEQQIDEGFLGSLLIPEQTFDLSAMDPELGQAAVQLDVDINNAPAGASIKIAVMMDPAANILSGFSLAADDAGFTIDGIAYVIVVDKVNITDGEIGDSTITLKVGKEWADEYGTKNIRILRIGDDGAKEVLSTEFTGYEGDQAVFEGISKNGLSYFGLAAVSKGGDGTNWALIGGIIGGIVVVLAIAAVILLRRRSQPASLSS